MRARALWFVPVVSAFLVSPLQAIPLHDWSKSVGGRSVASDASGNVVITGVLYGTVDFGGGPLTASGFTDVFIAKFDVDGNHLWSKQFGDEGEQYGEAVGIDAAGNIAITGYFTGTVDFGGGPLVSTDFDIDAFVAKFDASGNHIFSKRFDCSVYGLEVICTVAVDAPGNVVVAEQFVGSVDFGGGSLVGGGGVDFAIAKFDAFGNHLWSKAFGDGETQIAQSIATDGYGNVAVTGYFGGTIDFGGGPLSSLGDNMFIAKLDVLGDHIWSRASGGEYSWMTTRGQSVAADALGNVVATGYFNNTTDFGGGPLTSPGFAIDIFVAKYDASGNHLWSQNFGDEDYQQGQSVSLDVSGSVFVTGHFWGTVDFGGGVLTASPFFEDIFVAKFQPNGTHDWSANFGSEYNDRGIWIAAQGPGNFALTGSVAGPVSFGGEPVGPGPFLARFMNDEPIPVLISSFKATPGNGKVTVTWSVWSDEALESYTLYRHDDVHLQGAVVAAGDFNSSTRSFVDTSVEPAKTYRYELVIHTRDGNDVRSPMATATVPRLETTLGQNFPNPFRPATSIEYTLGERSHAVVGIYDASGRVVIRLDQGVREPGTYRADWDGRGSRGNVVGSGVYFYRLEGLANVAPKKMVRLK